MTDISKHVFSTNDFGIAFQKGSGLELVAFADADYASKATDRRSVSGGAIMCAGACVCWFSITQKCATLSTTTTEAEYVALANTIKEAMVLRYMCGTLFFRGLVRSALRLSRIMRGRRPWHKTQCALRIRSTLTCGNIFRGNLVFLRGIL